MNAEHAWQATLGQLQLEMSKASFDTWVRSAEFLNYDEDKQLVEIGVKNAYAKDWIEDRLSAKMKRLLTGMIGNPVEIKVRVWSALGSRYLSSSGYICSHGPLSKMHPSPGILCPLSVSHLPVQPHP